MEIKGYCRNCHYAKPIGQYRYECPFRLGKSHNGYGLVKPTSYCEMFLQKEEDNDQK